VLPCHVLGWLCVTRAKVLVLLVVLAGSTGLGHMYSMGLKHNPYVHMALIKYHMCC